MAPSVPASGHELSNKLVTITGGGLQIHGSAAQANEQPQSPMADRRTIARGTAGACRRTYREVAEVDERPCRAWGAPEDGEDEDPAEEEDEDVGGPDPGVHEPLRVPVQIRGRHRLHVQLRHRITLPPSLLLGLDSPSAACCCSLGGRRPASGPIYKDDGRLGRAALVRAVEEEGSKMGAKKYCEAGGQAGDRRGEGGERTGKAGGGEARRLAAAGGRGDGGNATATATDRVKRDGRRAGRGC